MAYISSTRQTSYTIATEEDGQQHQIVLDGKPLQIDWQAISPLATDGKKPGGQGGRYSLLIESQSYEILARQLPTSAEHEGLTYEILVGGQRFEVQVENERARALIGSLATSQETGDIHIRAPMPGLVLAVTRAVGESVARGETVAILEAMKMENDLSTPHDGEVKEILVSTGQTVNQGDVLLVIAGA